MRTLRSRLGLALLALVACAAPACGDDTPAGTGASSSSSGGGQGGSGGAPATDEVCVVSPEAAAFAGTDACPAPDPGQDDTFDAALAAGGLTRCDVRLLPEDIALSGWPASMLDAPHRLPDFAPLQRGPLRLPAYARETAAWLDAAAASKNPVSATIAALSARRGQPLDTCHDFAGFPADPADETPLATAVLLLGEHHGAPGDEAALRSAAAAVPRPLQDEIARIVAAIDWAASEVKAALGTTDADDLRFFARSHALYVPALFLYPLDQAHVDLLGSVDLGRITAAAAVLAKVIEDADLAAIPDATFDPFEFGTPLGRVLVHDSSDDTYSEGGAGEGTALLFDLGGDDVYQVPAGASDEDHPISIAIDVRGADRFGYLEVPDPLDGDLLPSDEEGRYAPPGPPTEDYGPITLSRVARQGAGLAGVGLLFDLGPEADVYRSLAVSQGFAAVGVGVLYDAGGNDEYAAEAGAQAAATFGVAALVDAAGDDVRSAATFAQGFAGAEGAAALVDLAGADEHTCDPGDPAVGGHPLYFSPQLPGAGNTSMCQGAGMGRRPLAADDAAHMAGGLGVLRDAGGADRYVASVFAQGTGYWQGTGLFLDGGAEGDEYDALWYVQGATAHFALSLFLDEAGNDLYNASFPIAATSIGVGHDFSASLHLDLGGDDTYRAPGLSLGSGNINGIGLLVNDGGDDVYLAAGDPTLGAGNYSAELPFGEARQEAPTIGIFVDAGGADTYTVAGLDRALNDTTWSYEPQPYPPPQMVTTEHGASADDAGGSVSLP